MPWGLNVNARHDSSQPNKQIGLVLHPTHCGLGTSCRRSGHIRFHRLRTIVPLTGQTSHWRSRTGDTLGCNLPYLYLEPTTTHMQISFPITRTQGSSRRSEGRACKTQNTEISLLRIRRVCTQPQTSDGWNLGPAQFPEPSLYGCACRARARERVLNCTGIST